MQPSLFLHAVFKSRVEIGGIFGTRKVGSRLDITSRHLSDFRNFRGKLKLLTPVYSELPCGTPVIVTLLSYELEPMHFHQNRLSVLLKKGVCRSYNKAE